MEEKLENRVKKAQKSQVEAEKLLQEYLPFIKKNISNTDHGVMEYDDRLAIAMTTFLQSIQSYEEGKGNFLAYSAKLIYHRLIDEERKELRYSDKIEVYQEKDTEEDIITAVQDRNALIQYEIEMEHRKLEEEIEAYAIDLDKYHLSFRELPNICPKRKKSRKLCIDIAQKILRREDWRMQFIKSNRIPQGQLAQEFQIPIKTIEKYRKYIAALVILLMGDYPNIQEFIPKSEVVKL